MSATVISAPFTWVNAFQALAVVLRDGTPKGKDMAIAELHKMAQAADLAAELLPVVKGFRAVLDSADCEKDGKFLDSGADTIDFAFTFESQVDAVLAKVKGGQ